MWGTTSPTNPISPAILTAPAANKAATAVIENRTFSTGTPSPLAVSSPRLRIVSALHPANAKMSPKTVYGKSAST